MIDYLDNRISKVEDNVYILHEKIDDLVETVKIQKKIIDDLKDLIDRTENRVAFMDTRFGGVTM